MSTADRIVMSTDIHKAKQRILMTQKQILASEAKTSGKYIYATPLQVVSKCIYEFMNGVRIMN